MGPVYEKSLLIRESHLDTFGHVNNARYLDIFEEARWDWITQGGFGLREVRERRIGPTILEITLKFFHELVNRETVTVRTEVIRYDGKVCDIHQSIIKADGAVACDAVFKCGLFDLDKRRLIPPTSEWARAVGIEPVE